MVIVKLARYLKFLTVAVLVFFSFREVAALEMMETIIEASTGAVVPGEWNRNFDAAKAKADGEHIPLVVFYGGVSCGVCENLQRALITDAFRVWQSERKLLLVFTTDNSRGNASSFSTPTPNRKQNPNPDAPDEPGFPYIAVYWNRDGVAPEKFSRDYRCFRGTSGMMLAKAGSLTEQFINSVEMVAGEYPYSGGEFVLPDTATTRLEVEENYADGFKVRVPLSRTKTNESRNDLVFNGITVGVEWAVGETSKSVELSLPAGLPAGTVLPLQLLANGGAVHATSSIAIVASQANSLRNPKWVGEAFSPGEWTMDLDKALELTGSGVYTNTLVLFTGALWCPHCQAFESGVFGTETFRNWATANKIALVELDNPHRVGTTKEEDLACHEVRGAGPTLLRYEAGMNSYLSRQESGASYLTRKQIPVDAAEKVLLRNRKLGYEWGEGTYCAPDGGRCGYPTVILLNADGSVVGRLNRLEGDSYAYDLTENMHRLDALLRLVDGPGEVANYPKTTSREMSPGASSASVDFQINDRVEYFALKGLPTGRVAFTASGAPAQNPVTLSVVRYENGVQTVLASARDTVTCAVSSEDNLFLKAEAYSESRAYGADAGFSATLSSSLILVPSEKTAVIETQGRSLQMEVTAGAKYRLEGFSGFGLSGDVFQDDGAAQDGGRYYTALTSGIIAVGAAEASLAYQIWRPGVIALAQNELTLFKATGSCVFSVVRSGGSSGAASVKVKVVGGDAERGVRYDWDDATTVSWADGESGAVELSFVLKPYEEFLPNQTAVLALADPVGSGSADVSDGTLTIMISDTDKPTLVKTVYDIPVFATFDAAAAISPQKAYNVGDGRVTLKKADGKLPPGVKLVYENGNVKLSGSPTKAGIYSYTFTMQQRQNGKLEVGPEITMKFAVATASDLAAGGNPLLDKAVKATLPLYEESDGVKALAGIVEYSVTKKNAIKAKCLFLEKKAVSFKGRWARIVDGTAETDAMVVKDGRQLRLSMDANGAMKAVVTNPSKGTVLSTSGDLKVGCGSYAEPYVGYYTVALRELDADDPMGDGYLLIKSVTAAGKARWSGKLANGQAVSGTSYLTVDSAGNAVLPVFKYTAKDWVAVSLKVRPDGSSLSFPRAVMNCDETVGRWSHYIAPASLHYMQARGCWYNKKSALDQCCYLQFFGTELSLIADIDGYRSEVYGEAPPAPQADVSVSADNLKLNEKRSDLKMKFSMKSGVFSGTMKLAFSGKSVNAKYEGVVIPGWHDCFCELPDPSDPYRIDVSQPFAVGAAWFADKVGGRAVKRGFPVRIDERGH